MTALKESILQELKKLNEEQLQKVADYIAFLKFQAAIANSQEKRSQSAVASPGWKLRRIPENYRKPSISPEEKAKQEAEKQERYQQGRSIFERVRPELINDHYNWYININLENGEYFIEQDYMVMFQKLCKNPQPTKTVTFRLNETGNCGTI